MNSQCDIDADKLRLLDSQGVNITELALHFGCSTHTIRKRMDLAGIERKHRSTPRRRDPTPAEIKKMAALLRAKRPQEVETERTWTPPHLSWDGQAFRTLN